MPGTTNQFGKDQSPLNLRNRLFWPDPGHDNFCIEQNPVSSNSTQAIRGQKKGRVNQCPWGRKHQKQHQETPVFPSGTSASCPCNLFRSEVASVRTRLSSQKPLSHQDGWRFSEIIISVGWHCDSLCIGTVIQFRKPRQSAVDIGTL